MFESRFQLHQSKPAGCRFYGGVAHLGERYIRIVEVRSSSLPVSTNEVVFQVHLHLEAVNLKNGCRSSKISKLTGLPMRSQILACQRGFLSSEWLRSISKLPEKHPIPRRQSKTCRQSQSADYLSRYCFKLADGAQQLKFKYIILQCGSSEDDLIAHWATSVLRRWCERYGQSDAIGDAYAKSCFNQCCLKFSFQDSWRKKARACITRNRKKPGTQTLANLSHLC